MVLTWKVGLFTCLHYLLSDLLQGLGGVAKTGGETSKAPSAVDLVAARLWVPWDQSAPGPSARAAEKDKGTFHLDSEPGKPGTRELPSPTTKAVSINPPSA